MDTILAAVHNRQDVILTTLQGFERSRFLLKCGLISLVKTQTDGDKELLKKIFHVNEKDYNIRRIYDETKHMPFAEFELKVTKYYGIETEENKSDSLDDQSEANLIVCNLKHLFEEGNRSHLHGALVVFDGITLQDLEVTCCEKTGDNCYTPGFEFARLKAVCWSILLACNPPVVGLSAELKLDPNHVVINDPEVARPKFRTFSTTLTSGPTNIQYDFDPSNKHPDIHSEVGALLTSCANRIKSGGIVVFFPSYGRMVEYHNAWKQSGLFERLGLPYGRENRAGDLFKNGLLDLARKPKSIFMFSIRYHQDEVLAEFALSMASVTIVVGLPYPFTNDSWEARIKTSNESYVNSIEGQLSGTQLFKYRAIEFMNGVLKRCLNEYRYRDCSFFLLDKGLRFERDKIAHELSDVQEESFKQAVSRFNALCRS